MALNREETFPLQDFTATTAAVPGWDAACRQRIEALQALARRGLMGLTLFLLLSVAVFMAAELRPLLSPQIYGLLGPAPPVTLISLALVVYCFSALILTLPRIVDGSDRYRGTSVIAYLTPFYAFYFYAQALAVNFWAVFAAGVLLLILEYISLLIYSRRAIRQEREVLDRHRRFHR